MTQEEKNLLIVDLCGRLPYGVMVQDDIGRTYKLNLGNAYLADLCYGNGGYIETPIKPYLRPMSSMTEEEKVEYTLYCFEQPFLQKDKAPTLGSVPMCIDWLNKKMFDYRGLIPKGLAESTEKFNPYK